MSESEQYYISESQPNYSQENNPKTNPIIIHHDNSHAFNFDASQVFSRGIKYLVEGLAVAFVAYYFVGKGKLEIKDIIILGVTAAFVFAILDTFSPTVSLGARLGAGFGIGQSLFGFSPAPVTAASSSTPMV